MIPNSRSGAQHGYDRLAPAYHAIEWLVFGNQLQQARVALIDDLPPWDRLLILGDGNGRLLAEFCARSLGESQRNSEPESFKRIVSVDQSRRMLSLQKDRIDAIGAARYVEFVQADARRYQPEASVYDLVVTPFFLDCFCTAELDAHLPRWLGALRDDGSLYQVDFVIPAATWQRPRARLLLWAMHLFFRWQTGLTNRHIVNFQPLLEQCGLRKVAEQVGGGGMIATQIWRKRSSAQAV